MRKVRISPNRHTLREQEIINKYEKLLIQQKQKYKKLESYNQRLYAQYIGLHDEYMRRLRKETGVRKGGLVDEGAIPPYHPLK